mgnify:CR=1 FL=1
MISKKVNKINRLLSSQPSGIVLTSTWLKDQGYSLELQKQYRKSKWFEAIGTGAMIRHGDKVDYLGGVLALQNQLGLSIHPAAKTALAIQGKAHYLEFSNLQVQLFGSRKDTLPLWFKNRDWGVNVECKLTSFLPPKLGLVEIEHKTFTILVSSPAKAIMECLYLAPRAQSLLETYQLMEGLNNLRPKTVQTLLEACSSIKVKRLFLFMADKAGHDWLNYLQLENVDLGSGKRALVSDGVYISKYQISIPKELAEVGL